MAVMRIVVAGIVVVAACGGGTRPAGDAPPVEPDAAFVTSGVFAPATIRFVGDSATAAFLPCELDGVPVDYGARVEVDDCVECQCTTYGLRCRRRATCPDARCVFVDGQVAQPGDAALVVESCFDCACDASGPACTRRTEAPCPTDGCKLGGTQIAIGQERLVSECHVCTCDATAGLLCRNLCHPECHCDAANPSCAAVCDALACPIVIPDQERIELACGSPVCDYGGLVGAPSCPM